MELKAQLVDWYSEYVQIVSVPSMAVSLETSLFMFDYISQNNPRKIADFGSGFSSVVLRLFPEKEVFTIDDDPLWLAKTDRFLRKKGLPRLNMLLFEDFHESNLDFVFYDFSNDPATRERCFSLCFERLVTGGSILVDDQHWPNWDSLYNPILRDQSRIIDIKQHTLDNFGRFAKLIVK